MNKAALATRRQQLLERCAEQRSSLVYEYHAFADPQAGVSPLAGQLLPRLLEHKRLVLGVAGTALGLALARPARMLRLIRLAASGWRMARHGLAVVARYRS
jgi:hypothetical protein